MKDISGHTTAPPSFLVLDSEGIKGANSDNRRILEYRSFMGNEVGEDGGIIWFYVRASLGTRFLIVTHTSDYEGILPTDISFGNGWEKIGGFRYDRDGYSGIYSFITKINTQELESVEEIPVTIDGSNGRNYWLSSELFYLGNAETVGFSCGEKFFTAEDIEDMGDITENEDMAVYRAAVINVPDKDPNGEVLWFFGSTLPPENNEVPSVYYSPHDIECVWQGFWNWEVVSFGYDSGLGTATNRRFIYPCPYWYAEDNQDNLDYLGSMFYAMITINRGDYWSLLPDQTPTADLINEHGSIDFPVSNESGIIAPYKLLTEQPTKIVWELSPPPNGADLTRTFTLPEGKEIQSAWVNNWEGNLGYEVNDGVVDLVVSIYEGQRPNDVVLYYGEGI